MMLSRTSGTSSFRRLRNTGSRCSIVGAFPSVGAISITTAAKELLTCWLLSAAKALMQGTTSLMTCTHTMTTSSQAISPLWMRPCCYHCYHTWPQPLHQELSSKLHGTQQLEDLKSGQSCTDIKVIDYTQVFGPVISASTFIPLAGMLEAFMKTSREHWHQFEG